MHPILRNILAIIMGWLGGSAVNMGFITLGHKILPIPNIDPNDMVAMADAMPTLEAKYFIFPFLAHALGTLVGAIIAYKIAATHKMKFALGIGCFFLVGGIVINMMLKGPMWFTIVDIALAYIPMAWIGGKIAHKL